MNSEQWFWLVLIAANFFSLGMRAVLMARDGVRKMDYVFIASGIAIAAYGAFVMAA
jgi:hypothetical protein